MIIEKTSTQQRTCTNWCIFSFHNIQQRTLFHLKWTLI